MGDTLSMLKRMIKWCPICGGLGKDPSTGSMFVSPTESKITPMSECPHCQEARTLITQLESRK